MKEISSGESPYFLYSCLSISETDLFQSMSLFAVKSWRGTYVHVDFGLCCVAFFTPSIARANFVFIYFSAFSASIRVLNVPIAKKVSEKPLPNSEITGELKTSNEPLPFDSVTSTLYVSI